MRLSGGGDDATLGFTLLTFGGPALFLLGQVFFSYQALGRVPRSRSLGLTALAILAVAVAVADTVPEDEQVPTRSA